MTQQDMHLWKADQGGRSPAQKPRRRRWLWGFVIAVSVLVIAALWPEVLIPILAPGKWLIARELRQTGFDVKFMTTGRQPGWHVIAKRAEIDDDVVIRLMPKIRDLGTAALDLSRLRVTDRGLAEIDTVRTLEWLDLEWTRVSDACVKPIARLEGLKGLFVNNTCVTGAGLLHLRRLRNLQLLVISGLDVSAHTIEALTHDNPGLYVDRRPRPVPPIIEN